MDKTANSKKQLRRAYQKRAYYFCVTIALSVLIIQFSLSFFYNLTKYFVLNNQINQLTLLNNDAVEKNKQLKTQLKVYSSYKGIEELARNNLKLVGKDEVLVLLKK